MDSDKQMPFFTISDSFIVRARDIQGYFLKAAGSKDNLKSRSFCHKVCSTLYIVFFWLSEQEIKMQLK